MAGVVQKAKEATVLVQQLHYTQDPRKRQSIVELLNQLWPSIRCRYDEDMGLKVWYLGDRVHRLPRALAFSASYVEVVQPDGRARVLKPLPVDVDQATILLSEFESKAGRTVWELIADPLDWL